MRYDAIQKCAEFNGTHFVHLSIIKLLKRK